MKKILAVTCLLVFFAVGVGSVYADNSDVGTPSFGEKSSNTMKLRYGFKGASVFDNSKKAWSLIQMTTITRHKVEGHVNQINDKFALAAGLHSVAVYDYSKHQWIEYKNATSDDSTGNLKVNFEISNDYVKVKTLNGPFIKYTTAGGWQQVSK